MKINTLATLITLALSASSISVQAATTLVADDNLNIIHGMNDTMRYRAVDSIQWTNFTSEKNFEDFRGDVTIVVAQRELLRKSNGVANSDISYITYEEGMQAVAGWHVMYNSVHYLAVRNTTAIPGTDDSWEVYVEPGSVVPDPEWDAIADSETSYITYEEGMQAVAGWHVIYHGKAYVAVRDTTSIPGTDDSWEIYFAPTPEIDVPSAPGTELGRFTFTHWTGEAAAQFQNQQQIAVAEQRKVIGTFSERGIDQAIREGTAYFTPEMVADKWSDKLTHLIYADAILSDGKIIADDYANGKGLMARLQASDKLKDVKKLITINGTGEQLFYTPAKNHYAQRFEDVLKDSGNDNTMADQMVAYMLNNHFDGINVKWVATDTDSDREHFSRLIQNLRTKLTTEGRKVDKYYQLTATVTGDHRNMQFIDPSVTAPLLDALNVATYDMNKPSESNLTAHRAGLYANLQDTDKKLNVNAALKEYQQVYHVPKNKLVMGVDFAGYGWGSVSAEKFSAGLPGLFNQGTATLVGPWDDTNSTIVNGYTPYSEIKAIAAVGDIKRYYDAEARVPYLYNQNSGHFYTYEDEQSLREKVDYIQTEGLAGISIADLSGDTQGLDLGNVVNDIIESPVLSDVKFAGAEIIGATPHLRMDVVKGSNHHYVMYVNGSYRGELRANGTSSGFYRDDSKDMYIMRIQQPSLKAGDVITVKDVNVAEGTGPIATSTLTEQSLAVDETIVNDSSLIKFDYVGNVGSKQININILKGYNAHYVMYLNDRYAGELFANGSSPYFYRHDTSEQIGLINKSQLAEGTKVKLVKQNNISHKFDVVGQFTVSQYLLQKNSY